MHSPVLRPNAETTLIHQPEKQSSESPGIGATPHGWIPTRSIGDIKGAPRIRDLALIGDRRTAAVIDAWGSICWYCPHRFDQPSVFASLLDSAAGHWSIDLPGLRRSPRHYLGDSGMLETRLHGSAGIWTVTDWMPLEQAFEALCREVGPAPEDAWVEVAARPGYGGEALLHEGGEVDGCTAVYIGTDLVLYASVRPMVNNGRIRYRVPKDASAWFVLTSAAAPVPDPELLATWRQETRAAWQRLGSHTDYEGPYQRAVTDSLRALRLLTHGDSGGVIAAATLGLPEVPGGIRNYDYRYVWLRDAGMIASALTRADSDSDEERRFLDFLCAARDRQDGRMPLPPFMDLDGKAPPPTRPLPWRGYQDSRPVVVGNDARDQLQLDGLANVLLAAKLIYNKQGDREHWDTVAEVADYLLDHWREPDHGIWEEGACRQYTTGKVVTSVALRFIAEHADDPQQAARWRQGSEEIRDYVAQHCRTTDGAFAAVAGDETVDVSAALYPVWDFCKPDTPQMLATLRRLEQDHSEDGLLYRRHLVCDDAGREGIFLAGSLWVAQYWIMRDELDRAEQIVDRVLDYANDVGLFAEEADPTSDAMLGNFPQSFVHAALIGVAIDLRDARQAESNE